MRLLFLAKQAMLWIIVVQVVISPFLSIFQRLVALSSLLVASMLLSMVIVLFLQKSGSADVLEELGINVVLAPEKLAQVLDETGIAFLFAQKMHPAMRYISPARQALGIPTVMNLIGPLTHPMDLETQLLGLLSGGLTR